MEEEASQLMMTLMIAPLGVAEGKRGWLCGTEEPWVGMLIPHEDVLVAAYRSGHQGTDLWAAYTRFKEVMDCHIKSMYLCLIFYLKTTMFPLR